MKKLLAGLLGFLAPSIGDLIAEAFKSMFRKVKPVDKLASVLQPLYIIVDKELETIAKTTETDKDDVAVAALKKAIEDIAKENGIELQNTDAD